MTLVDRASLHYTGCAAAEAATHTADSEVPAGRPRALFLLDFCRMDIGPIFFKEISFFDFLEEST
jgi:hypothetical protein